MKNPKARTSSPGRGMWSTLGAIVQSGWGPTLRLLSIIAVAGLAFGGHFDGAVSVLSSLRDLIGSP